MPQDLALQAHSLGPLHPYVIARNESYAHGERVSRTWCAIHPTDGETGPFFTHEKCEEWIRFALARKAPHTFEHDGAPEVTLR